MNIGIVCYPTYGGSGVVATELGKALAEEGHQVHFITYAMPFRLDGFYKNVFYHEVEMPNYPLFEFQLYTLALASKMVDVIRYEKLDIVHVHYAIPHATSAYLAKKIIEKERDIKIVTTLHGTDITLIGLEPSFLPLVKFAIEESDAVTSVSRFLREKTLTNFNIKNKEIDVIQNFIDTETYKPFVDCGLRQQYAPQGEKILMHTSNFRPVKRVADTVRILHEVLKTVPAKLILVGDGPERSEAERLSRELGIAEHVRFLGKQNGLPQILSAADVFLLPSQSESFGLAALEAMSCGVPVVATSSGGIPEVVVHGETGYVAEIGDTERMAKYVVDLLTNPKKHKRFAEASRQRAIDEFETKLLLPQYTALYERLLATPSEKTPSGTAQNGYVMDFVV
ncbi:MAG: N-acetyl-alpha-D-glucosaminyl L-malate synthase BshA [Ignavibacteria bacterium]|nr:N-acetyl-alpha-D-glucosaminyl L-malate synthase BshA [Ignavibacteria bacterium]MBL7992316.1 N-acetyl-alpha-D-glucosaminyl L-malate synthase BshA [Candidatus Kapabacteria bacterium]